MKIIVIAPVPPPVTGQSLATTVLVESLKSTADAVIVDLSKHSFDQGFNSIQRVKEIYGIFLRIWRHRKDADVVYFNVSQSISGNLKDLIIYALCWSKLNRMIIHLHGGAGMREIMHGKHSWLRGINVFFLRRLGGVIVLGGRLKNIYSDIVHPSRLHTIPNFALDENFVTTQEIEAKFSAVSPLRLLFLSNLLPGKGHHELLASLALLPAAAHQQLRVDFAGGFESESDEIEFRRRVGESAGIEVNVHGIVHGEVKKDLLRSAHLFCLPTYYPYEGQPISILEAYASGCAVITTNHSGIFDVFTPDLNGIEVFPRSPESIAQAIEHAIAHPDEIFRHATHNHQQALEKYRTSIHIKALDDVIAKVARSADGIVDAPSKRLVVAAVANSDHQVCSNCIMDTSDPNILFDARGWCDYCNNFEATISPNWRTDSAGHADLMRLAHDIKKDGVGKEFDCIIGLSGGLDSSYTVFVAKEKMGLRPLLVHVDAGWNTDQAVGNIEKLVDGLGLELHTEVVNWQEMKDLQVAFLRSGIPDQDLPQDAAFFSGLYKFARAHNIKHVITGSNFSTECCREPEEWGGYLGIDKTLFLDIHRQFGKIPLKTFPLTDILVYKLWFQRVLGMRVHHPLNFVPFVKADAEKELEARFGWKRFQHKHHESRFTRFYEDYWLPRRFGYQKRRAHFSSLIMTKQMTREAALERISRPEMDEQFLKQEFEYVAHKLDLSVSELQAIFDLPKKTYRDYKNKRVLIGSGASLMRTLGLEKRYFR